MSTNSPATITRVARNELQEVQRKPWFSLLARTGLVSRAVIYALLGYFAVDIAIHGSSPAQANGTGALTDVARQPGAPMLLAVLALGLLAYGSWRIVSAIGGTTPDRGADSGAKRAGWAFIAAVYFVLFGQAVSLVTGSGASNGGPTSHPSPFVGRMLRWPAGPELVGFAATAIICSGVALAIWACIHDFDKVFDTERMSHAAHFWARATQICGDITRGTLVNLIGIYAIVAAATDDPVHVKSLDQVLEAIAHQSYGGWLIGLAALGLFSFSASSIFEAAFRKV
jgi:hypothetical protein